MATPEGFLQFLKRHFGVKRGGLIKFVGSWEFELGRAARDSVVEEHDNVFDVFRVVVDSADTGEKVTVVNHKAGSEVTVGAVNNLEARAADINLPALVDNLQRIVRHKEFWEGLKGLLEELINSVVGLVESVLSNVDFFLSRIESGSLSVADSFSVGDFSLELGEFDVEIGLRGLVVVIENCAAFGKNTDEVVEGPTVAIAAVVISEEVNAVVVEFKPSGEFERFDAEKLAIAVGQNFVADFFLSVVGQSCFLRSVEKVDEVGDAVAFSDKFAVDSLNPPVAIVNFIAAEFFKSDE